MASSGAAATAPPPLPPRGGKGGKGVPASFFADPSDVESPGNQAGKLAVLWGKFDPVDFLQGACGVLPKHTLVGLDGAWYYDATDSNQQFMAEIPDEIKACTTVLLYVASKHPSVFWAASDLDKTWNPARLGALSESFKPTALPFIVAERMLANVNGDADDTFKNASLEYYQMTSCDGKNPKSVFIPNSAGLDGFDIDRAIDHVAVYMDRAVQGARNASVKFQDDEHEFAAAIRDVVDRFIWGYASAVLGIQKRDDYGQQDPSLKLKVARFFNRFMAHFYFNQFLPYLISQLVEVVEDDEVKEVKFIGDVEVTGVSLEGDDESPSSLVIGKDGMMPGSSAPPEGDGMDHKHVDNFFELFKSHLSWSQQGGTADGSQAAPSMSDLPPKESLDEFSMSDVGQAPPEKEDDAAMSVAPAVAVVAAAAAAQEKKKKTKKQQKSAATEAAPERRVSTRAPKRREFLADSQAAEQADKHVGKRKAPQPAERRDKKRVKKQE